MEKGLPVCNYWVVLPVHFISVELLDLHRIQQARHQGPTVFQVISFRDVASIDQHIQTQSFKHGIDHDLDDVNPIFTP